MGALSTTPTLARAAVTIVGTTTAEVVVAATARSVGGSEAGRGYLLYYLVLYLVPSILFDAMQKKFSPIFQTVR